MESEERGVRSSAEWNSRLGIQQPGGSRVGMTNRKRKPASAYQYYQKLVQDFDSLEREMESHQEEQSELEAQLKQAQAKIRVAKDQDRQTQQTQWEQERDRQLENLVWHRTTLDALRAQTEELEAQGLRLQAEMEVLHERQQETSETEARRIRRLVHERTTLLEDELAKGKLDLDYIAQVVSSTQRQGQKQEKQQEGHEQSLSSVQTLVQDVQERRRRDFEVAEANFKARMRSFQLEKEALAKKAKELHVTKQRAIEILSQNQQIAIKGFFDTPPTVQEREEEPSSTPSLDFQEILQSLNQSGAQVEQIQTIDSEKNSGRRELAEALEEARTTLERGNQRVEAIQKSILDRKSEAHRLGIRVDLPGVNCAGYDGAWGIESYSPRQYGTAYFIRGLVFSWMDVAVAEVSAQPAKELLEFELKRWRDTHASVEQDCTRERNLRLGGQMLDNLISEVVTEIAEDIRMEFESSARRVRTVFTSALKNVLFPSPRETLTPPQAKKMLIKSQATVSVNPSASRSSLFLSSLDHLRTLRNRRSDPKSIGLLHQCSLPVSQRPATTTVATSPVQTKSPAKKIFGIFGTSRGAESPIKKEVPLQPPSSISAASKLNEVEIIPFLPPEVPTSLSSASKIAMSFWQNEPHLRLRTILVPPSLGCPSCLQLSPNGDLLVCGTTEGEIILWDLLPDKPVVLRVWAPPKAERSRITRVVLSPDAQVVIAFFRRKTASVFSINSNAARSSSHTKPKQAMHSEDCFPIDSTKYKPRNLDLLLQISTPDVLAELSFTPDVRERAPNAVAKDPATGWSAAELSCGSFFSSFSLTGTVASNITLLFGTSTGDLLKLNSQTQKERNGAQPWGIQAAFDFPAPNHSDSLNAKPIRREFFRGHQRPVLFASCIHRCSGEANVTEILSVDQDGIVCIWEYSSAQFTGFGWFESKSRVRLELACSNSGLMSVAAPPSGPKRLPPKRVPLQPENSGPDELAGELLQVGLTPDDTRLVCMVFYADPTKKEVAGTLRFLQLLTASMHLDQVQLNVGFAGGSGAPRFALTTNFLLLLANNLVHVFALRTGKRLENL